MSMNGNPYEVDGSYSIDSLPTLALAFEQRTANLIQCLGLLWGKDMTGWPQKAQDEYMRQTRAIGDRLGLKEFHLD